ncbi:hypothetical protein NDU88_003942 [Pleurodeles waltl]|uniref:Uncharacterized protein n=1 Tax=Pleurodeles waltl TaxID=8319 RepID=A0AAV7LMZ1_PLEWA|nr:hypothetical protein NDU88_003942 [Pleurodeles waltl]
MAERKKEFIQLLTRLEETSQIQIVTFKTNHLNHLLFTGTSQAGFSQVNWTREEDRKEQTTDSKTARGEAAGADMVTNSSVMYVIHEQLNTDHPEEKRCSSRNATCKPTLPHRARLVKG